MGAQKQVEFTEAVRMAPGTITLAMLPGNKDGIYGPDGIWMTDAHAERLYLMLGRALGK